MTRTVANQYLIACAFAVGVAIAILVHERHRVALLRASYWRWLLRPWKLATAALSTAVLVGAAPFMDDPSWTPGVAFLMSLATFATAPWVVGELWRRRGRGAIAFAAVCTWLLSSSWTFDLYWYARRGFHPADWLENLMVSSALYLAAGLLWSFEARPGGQVGFAFTDGDWPVPGRVGGVQLVAPVVALMVAGGATVFLPFWLR